MRVYVKFDIPRRPYYDRNGCILRDVSGRRNIQGRDDFTGGGNLLPAMPDGVQEIQHWTVDQEHVVELELDNAALSALLSRNDKVTYTATRRRGRPLRTAQYRFGAHNPTILSAQAFENWRVAKGRFGT